MKLTKKQLKRIIKEELGASRHLEARERLFDLAGEVSVLAHRVDDQMRNDLLNLQGELEAVANMLR
jgi:hypothetical protein